MYFNDAIRNAPQAQLASLTTLLLQRWTAWRQVAAPSSSAQHHTRDSAAMLYSRAARYEATQPGFAADLRAAAEAMDRLAKQR
jgi:hypothetical protein